MKKHWKKCLALTLSLSLAFGAPAAVLCSRMSFGAERPATVKATSLNIRSGPGTGNASLGKLSYGAAVTVLGETTGGDGSLWYQIRYTAGNGQTATGYVSSRYIQFPTTYSSDADFEAYLNAQGFPESYRPALRELHARYPQWVFTAMDTGLDWNEVIQNESLVGRNLVSRTSISSWKSTAAGAYDWSTGVWPGFDGSAWVAASEDIIRYYMDPRNFINETYIFQFLSQSYDASAHTREGLLSLVKGTFLEGSASTSGTYTGGSGSAGSGGSTSPAGGSSGSGYGPGYGNGTGSASGNDTGNTSGRTPGSGGTGNEVVVGVPPGGKTTGGGTSGSSGVGAGAGPGSSGAGVGAGPGGSTGQGAKGSGGSAAPGGGSPASGTSGSDVTVGIPPGKNVSRADVFPGLREGSRPSGLTVSRREGSRLSGLTASLREGSRLSGLTASLHEVSRAGATVIQVGPGGQTGGQDSTGSGTGGGSGSASYVDILMQAAQQSGVSPYVLASMILQEQGSQGRSESISGASGYYNFYNFEAYASNGMTAVQRGLWYASQSGSYMRPWDSVDKSIIGGACQYGQNYVQAGQDTFYLKKFNVQGSNLYKHQYMTNVEAAAAEGAKMGTAYSEAMRQLPLRFKIPVYRNMPAQACVKPVLDGSPNNKLSTLGVDGFTLSPSFDRDTESYDVSVNSSVSSVVLRASAVDSTAQIRGAGTVSLNASVTEVKVDVTAQNGTVRTYTVRITKSESGPQSNGTIAGGGTGDAGSPSGGTGGNGTSGGTSGGTGGNGSAGSPSSGQGPGGSSGLWSGPGGGSTSGSSSGSSGGPGGSNVTIVY